MRSPVKRTMPFVRSDGNPGKRVGVRSRQPLPRGDPVRHRFPGGNRPAPLLKHCGVNRIDRPRKTTRRDGIHGLTQISNWTRGVKLKPFSSTSRRPSGRRQSVVNFRPERQAERGRYRVTPQCRPKLRSVDRQKVLLIRYPGEAADSLPFRLQFPGISRQTRLRYPAAATSGLRAASGAATTWAADVFNPATTARHARSSKAPASTRTETVPSPEAGRTWSSTWISVVP
jgi:hypothetical protein